MTTNRTTSSLLTRRSGGASFIALLAALYAFSFAAPVTAAGSTTLAWTATISPNSTVTTAQLNLSFTGLDSSSAVQLTLQPTNVVVGDQFATADGSAQFSFKIPASVQAGDYSIRAVGVSNSGSAFQITVATFTVASTGIVSDSTVRDGVLSLEIPIGTTATFQNPVVEGGLSVTRGALGLVTVRDERSVTKPGWALTASVSPLSLSTDSSVTMPAVQLGVQPLVLSGGIGVSTGPTTTPGSAVAQFVFAESPAGVQAPITTLGGNLTLVAPPQLPVGTYTGNIAFTLISR